MRVYGTLEIIWDAPKQWRSSQVLGIYALTVSRQGLKTTNQVLVKLANQLRMYRYGRTGYRTVPKCSRNRALSIVLCKWRRRLVSEGGSCCAKNEGCKGAWEYTPAWWVVSHTQPTPSIPLIRVYSDNNEIPVEAIVWHLVAKMKSAMESRTTLFYGTPQGSTTSISLALHFHYILPSYVSLQLHSYIHPNLAYDCYKTKEYPAYLFALKICRVWLYTELFYAIIPTLFLCFLPICYPLHFCFFSLTM